MSGAFAGRKVPELLARGALAAGIGCKLCLSISLWPWAEPGARPCVCAGRLTCVFLASGGLPTSVGNLTSLVTLLASHNNLTGTIPASLAALPNLQTLDLSFNRYPNGSLPAGLENVTNFSNQTVAVSLCLSRPPA